MNNRIKEIRIKLGMNQSDFSSRIGIGQSGLSAIEKGIRNATDRIINDICREFNVNEDWLRTGAGGDENMFVPKDMQYFQNVGKLGKEKNEFKKFFLNTMMSLPDESWDYIYKEFKKFEKEEK